MKKPYIKPDTECLSFYLKEEIMLETMEDSGLSTEMGAVTLADYGIAEWQ